MSEENPKPNAPTTEAPEAVKNRLKRPAKADEVDGPTGEEPTRYGDWEKKGRCIDF